MFPRGKGAELRKGAKLRCPWKRVQFSLSPIYSCEEASVEILGGVCEAAHECHTTHCKFYDVSEAGDARFLIALRRSQTLEGYLLENVAKQ